MKLPAPLSIAVACVALVGHVAPASAQPEQRLFVDEYLLQSAALVDADGEAISGAAFTPLDWYPVSVPSTVLRALVANGVYPDPYVGMNNMQIPDANDAFNREYDLARFSHLPDQANPWSSPWWYRAEFEVPDVQPGTEVWLNFEGINYRADVWLNGQHIADAEQVVGMFEMFTFRVTDAVRPGRRNVLAVQIHPLDEPGLPAEPQLEVFGPFGPNGGPTGDIGKNVTMQSSVGWDWIPAVRDRNMGIWQDVFLSFTGPVDLRFPHIVTDLPLPDTRPAILTLSAELWNTAEEPVTGTLEVNIRGGTGHVIQIRQPVSLAAGQDSVVTLRPEQHPQLVVDDPLLWWPVGYGEPHLYDLELQFATASRVSDRVALAFGIREVGSEVTEIDGWLRRDFFVNGRRIQIKGGAWVPDMLLARDRQRYLDELRLSREAHFNMVRIWGGGITPPAEFFEIADELGLLVWHDFWITGDCQGTWTKGTRDWPLEGDVFGSNAVNTAKRLRNHPSLLTWTAGNEGFPRRELYDVLRNEIAAGLDGTRTFLLQWWAIPLGGTEGLLPKRRGRSGLALQRRGRHSLRAPAGESRAIHSRVGSAVRHADGHVGLPRRCRRQRQIQPLPSGHRGPVRRAPNAGGVRMEGAVRERRELPRNLRSGESRSGPNGGRDPVEDQCRLAQCDLAGVRLVPASECRLLLREEGLATPPRPAAPGDVRDLRRERESCA